MKTKASLAGLLTVLFFLFPLMAAAQVNSWTKPTSGFWHEPFWSLGTLPNSTQSYVMFTNAGWKALAIDRFTATNYPVSLSIRELRVSAPIDSFNTLMLNFAGREWPLRVAGFFNLGWNCAFLTMDSGLTVADGFFIDGTVNHTDYSEVVSPLTYLGTISEGPVADYNMTNGTLTVGNLLWAGVYSYGIVRQYGGLHRVRELRMGRGRYELYGGEVAAETLRLGSTQSIFEQRGGNVTVTNPLVVGYDDGFYSSPYNIEGRYILSNGTLRTPAIRVGTPNDGDRRGGSEGAFSQYGGSNLTMTVHVGAGGTGNTLRCNYTLSDGMLMSSATTVGPGYDVSFSHGGGVHVIDGPLKVLGEPDPSAGFNTPPHYAVWPGAVVRSRALTVSQGVFFHIDGTNEVGGDLLLDGMREMPTEYILLNGRVTTSNTIARVGRSPQDHFRHDGGVHVVSGRLGLTGYTPWWVLYEMTGGQLIAPEICITNGIFGHYEYGVISNSNSITLAGGHWGENSSGITRLGALKLAAGTNESAIWLGWRSSTLQFLASGGVNWAPSAQLIIVSWRGSANGGGDHQVIFGNHSSGLTAQQLRQIRFRYPAGFPDGDYPARILATGEIVPAPPPSLAFNRDGSRLVLQWPTGYTLQGATNISGPFGDMMVASPFSFQAGTNVPWYFRLRR